MEKKNVASHLKLTLSSINNVAEAAFLLDFSDKWRIDKCKSKKQVLEIKANKTQI